MSAFKPQTQHPSNKKKDPVPETIVGAEGTAKRNILRKGGPVVVRKGSASGALVDDGSLYEDGAALDDHDPNYDSEEEDAAEVYIPRDSQLRAAVGDAKLNLTTFKKIVEPLISEFFVHGDIDEVFRSLIDIGTPEYSYEFVKRAINMSLDKGDRERELISRVLSMGYPNILSSNMIGKGFERLFELMDEIEKDCPAARELLAKFLTRAVMDEVLPPSFLADAVVCNLGGDVVEMAKTKLSLHHGGARLERSWGPGDGRPVSDMKVAVDQLLDEFLLSADIEEATRCIVELQAPQFFHEVVKRVVVHGLDVTVDKQLQLSELLAYLMERDQLSKFQASKGFDRLFSLLPELVLDSPSAAVVLQGFMERAVTDAVLPPNYAPPTEPRDALVVESDVA